MVSVIGREAATEANESTFSLESLGQHAPVSKPESCSSVVLPGRRISPFGDLGIQILH